MRNDGWGGSGGGGACWKEGVLAGRVGTNELKPVEVGINGCKREAFAGTGAKGPLGAFGLNCD